MNEKKYFLAQVKHNQTTDVYDKGLVVKDTYNQARQSYHAYLGAYAYGNDSNIDFVECVIFDSAGVVLDYTVYPDERIVDYGNSD